MTKYNLEYYMYYPIQPLTPDYKCELTPISLDTIYDVDIKKMVLQDYSSIKEVKDALEGYFLANSKEGYVYTLEELKIDTPIPHYKAYKCGLNNFFPLTFLVQRVK